MKKDLIFLLKKTKFPYLWSSQILSQVTINMMNFLLLIKLYETTNSTLAVSLLWVSYAMPAIIIGPIASAFVDISDRRLLLIITNFLQSMVILYYALFFRDNVFLVYGTAFFYSLLNQFYVPSESASISSLVSKDHLPRANGLFFITQQLSLVVGFGVASLFKQFFGFNTSLFICSILLFIAFICVIFLPKMKFNNIKHQSIEDSIVTFFRSIYSGYKYIKTSKNILITFLTLILIQVLFSIVVISVPTIAEKILKISAGLSGIYIVIPAGLGSMLGAIYIPLFLKNKWRKRKLIETSLMILSILMFLEVFLVFYLPPVVNIIVSAVIIFFLGIFFTGIIIPSQTFLQEHTHDTYKGRIFGNMWFITTIATIIPVIFYGVITEIFGIKFVMLTISLICFLMYYLSKKETFKIYNRFEKTPPVVGMSPTQRVS